MNRTLAFMATLALLAGTARADLKILRGGSPVPSSWVLQKTISGGEWTIDIRPVGSPGVTVEIVADGTDEKIGSLTVRPLNDLSSSPQQTLIKVFGESGGSITGFGTVDYIAETTIPDRWPNFLALNLTLEGDLGTPAMLDPDCTHDVTLEVHVLGGLINGDVYQDITLLTDAYSDDGNFGLSVTGDFLADLYVPGDITTSVIDGDFGTPTAMPCLTVGGSIGSLDVSNLYATVTADNVESIQVFGSGDSITEATDAVFDGSLTCNTFDGDGKLGLRIWGDLEADVDIDDEMIGLTNRIAVGRELIGDITIGAGGLGERGITIGWMPTATGVWTGDITVGTTTLAPKGDYTQSGLGDGGVGLAPYGLHKQACDPAYTGSAWATIDVPPGGEDREVNLVHYNFISDPEAAPSDPFEVTWAAGDHCSGPNCIHGANYDASWDFADDAYPLTDPLFPRYRTMRLEGFIEPNKHYHVVVDGTLECFDLFGGGSGVETKPYVYVIYGY